MRRYTILLDPDPEFGVYTVTVPGLPGVVTQGSNLDESLARAREAIELHLRGLIADGEEISQETGHNWQRFTSVRLSPSSDR